MDSQGATLVETIGPSWSTKKLLAELGGVSAEAVNQRVGRGTLLGLTTSDGAVIYPIFQFVRRNGRLAVKPGLARMITKLKGQEAWHVAVLLNTPAPELDGQTPVEWERRHGESSELNDLADRFAAEAQRQ